MSAYSFSLYEKVLRVTQVYLGPAAERFIDRQVENHLHKSATKMSLTDLKSLIDWIKISVSLLTEDSEIVEEYISELQKLIDSGEKPKKRKEQANA